MFKRKKSGLYIKCSKEEKNPQRNLGKGAPKERTLPRNPLKKYMNKEMFIMKYLTSDSLNSLLKPFSGFFDNNYSVMRTDVKSNDKEYTLSVDLPGIDKNNIDISLQDGYLTIEAVRNNEETEKDENSNYVFRERTYGRMSRTFYVGEGIREENIKAKYENGIWTVVVPKYKEEEKALKKTAIE